MEHDATQSKIPPEHIGQFRKALPAVRQWVDDTLRTYHERAAPVDSGEYPGLAQAFPHELLNRVRCVVVADNPPFPPLSRLGLPELAAFESFPISGITYRDTFFVRDGRQSASLCFHEIVHVVQWDRLGVDRFLMAYGTGLMQAGYRNSPLEEMAYRLQADFDGGHLPRDLVGMIQQATDRIWEDLEALMDSF
jgi:hypothetical protein